VGVLTGSKIAGSEQVRGLGSSCVAFDDTIVVGAQGDPATPGRAFVLRPPYGTWTYTAIPVFAELVRKDQTKGDSFGASVAHCFDGTDHYIAVGAPTAAAPIGVPAPGQVFIFRGLEPSSTQWNTSPIANPNPSGGPDDLFGASVAINPSGDGSFQWDGTLTLAVGAPGADEGQGAVFVGRTTQPGAWASPFQFSQALVPLFPEATEDFRTAGFGASIAMTGGVTLAVGSPNDPNFTDMIEGTGAVWIYRYADGTFVSNEEDKASIFGPAEGGALGTSVAFAETSPQDMGQEMLVLPQAEHLIVGAPGMGAGDVYRFFNDPIEGWPAGMSFSLDAQLSSLTAKAGDRFGAAVAASSYPYGAWCLVGSPGVAKAEQDGGGFLYAVAEAPPQWLETPPLIAAPPVRWGGLVPDWWKKYTPQIPKYIF
jgi:hypothetical protein